MTEPVRVQVWYVPADSENEWVGPLTIGVNGVPTTNYKLTFGEYSDRPTDWEVAVPHPDGAVAGLGVVIGVGSTHPIVAGKSYRIRVQIDLGTSEPVLDNVALVIAE